MRIIVTGALGHIGSAFIRNERLLIPEFELVLVDNLATQRFSSVFDLRGARFRLVEGDVSEVVTPELLSSASVLVHLAAIADPGASFVKPEVVHQHNLSKTRHVVDACVKAGVPLVFPSSTSIYGGFEAEIDEREEVPRPHTPYAKCKVAEEQAIRDAMADGLAGAVLRFGTIFGPSPGMRFHTAVNRFCWQATVGSPISVFRTAMNQLRPYLAVEDASNALAHTVLGGHYQQTPINIATCNTTVAEIVRELRQIVPDLAVEEVDSPAMNDDSFGVSTYLAAALGYSFGGTMSNGIRETMDLLAGLRPS